MKINNSDKETKLSNSTGLTIKDKSSGLLHTQINDNSISLNNGNTQINDNSISLNNGNTQLVNGALNMSDGVNQLSLSNTEGLSLNNGDTILSTGLLTLDTNTTLSSANGLKLKNATDTDLETQLTDQKLTIENKNRYNSPGKTSISYNSLLMEYAPNATDAEPIIGINYNFKSNISVGGSSANIMLLKSDQLKTRLYTDTSKSGLLLTTDPEIHKAIYIDADLNNLNLKMTDDNEDSLIEILTVGNEGQVKGNKLLSLEKLNCPPSIPLNKGDIYADGTLYCDNFHVKSKIESDTLLSVVSSEDPYVNAFQVNNSGTLTLKNVGSGQTQTIEINAATSKISGLDTLEMSKFNVNNAGILTLKNVGSTRTIEINAGTSTISGLDTIEFNGDNSEINNLQTISLNSLEFTGENSKIESLDSLECTNIQVSNNIICDKDIHCSGTFMTNKLIAETIKSHVQDDSARFNKLLIGGNSSCSESSLSLSQGSSKGILLQESGTGNSYSVTQKWILHDSAEGTNSTLDDSITSLEIDDSAITFYNYTESPTTIGLKITSSTINIGAQDTYIDGGAIECQTIISRGTIKCESAQGIQVSSDFTNGPITTILEDEICTDRLFGKSITFEAPGYAETSSSTTTTYGNGNTTPCPQLLLVDGPVNIYFDSITQGRIYHAFWKSGSQNGTITFYRLHNGHWISQKNVPQPSASNGDGGLIFVHDGSGYFSIGCIPGV